MHTVISVNSFFEFCKTQPPSVTQQHCTIQVHHVKYHVVEIYRRNAQQQITAYYPFLLRGLSDWHLLELKPAEAIGALHALHIGIDDFFRYFWDHIDLEAFLEKANVTFTRISVMFGIATGDLLALRNELKATRRERKLNW